MIPREHYLERIRPFVDQDLIKVITGVRRSGKSILLELIKLELLSKGIQPNQFISYNFEDLTYAPLCTAKALHEELSRRIQTLDDKAYLFLDEIQEVQEWEKCVNSLRVRFSCDIYLTGSNAQLLSGELATYLAGRYVEFVVYPFSLAEFSMAYLQSKMNVSASEVFSQYLQLGGMPYLHNLHYETSPSRQYLFDVYNSVVLKDIVKRNNVRDIDLLERIIHYVSTNTGQTFSATAISKYFKSENRNVSAETILNYLKYCEHAFLFFPVQRHDLVRKRILSVQDKYYLVDHGIRDAVWGGGSRDIHLVLENIVYLELLRRGYSITVGKIGEREIDFVGEKRGNRVYIQVTYLLASPETIEREFGVYAQVNDHFPKYVLSMDELDMSRNGIKHKNIREFLLQPNWE